MQLAVCLLIITHPERITTDLGIGNTFKWSVSHTPYLIHENSITPHITSSGVLLVVKSLYIIIKLFMSISMYCIWLCASMWHRKGGALYIGEHAAQDK